LTRTENGIKVTTDHGEELIADVVLFATGKDTIENKYLNVLRLRRPHMNAIYNGVK